MPLVVTRRWTLPILALAAIPVIWWAIGGAESQATGHHAVAPAHTLEEITGVIGCTPEIQGRQPDMRQAMCTAPTYQSVVLTFAADKNQTDWLKGAQAYGGTYLVGTRWVVVGPEKELTGLVPRLGGHVETAEHGGHS